MKISLSLLKKHYSIMPQIESIMYNNYKIGVLVLSNFVPNSQFPHLIKDAFPTGTKVIAE